MESNDYLPGCDAVYTGKSLPPFQGILLAQSPGSKSVPNRQGECSAPLKIKAVYNLIPQVNFHITQYHIQKILPTMLQMFPDPTCNVSQRHLLKGETTGEVN